MPLESATYLSDLNSSNPANTDSLSQADSHLRLIKSTVKNTFPNITGPVTATQAQLNTVSGYTTVGLQLLQAASVSQVQSLLGINTVTGSPNLPLTGGTLSGPLYLSGDPTTGAQAASKSYVDTKVAAVTTAPGSYLTQSVADGRYLSLASGGTVSGTIFANFQGANHNFSATSSHYFDGTNINCVVGGGVRWYVNSGAFVCQVDPQKAGGGPWSAASDERLKDDIEDYEKGLADLEDLEPVSFRYNDLSGHNDGKTYVGLVAQEVQGTTFSSMVYEDKETGYLRVDPNELVYALVNAVKELSARVRELEDR